MDFQPSADMIARSFGFLAATVTEHPIPASSFVRHFPMRPQPMTNAGVSVKTAERRGSATRSAHWAVIAAFMGKSVAGWASLACIVCFMGGMQCLFLGVIGEYIGKIYMETKHRPRYIISERTWEEKEA